MVVTSNQNKNSVEMFSKFKDDLNNIFDIKRLEQVRPIIELGEFYPTDLPDKIIVDNFLIKLNNSGTYILGVLECESINRIISDIEKWAKLNDINLKERYCFITLDQGEVSPGETLRDTRRGRMPMWHLDGMQGDEVKEKQRPDIQFIWSDNLGTKFSFQKFDMNGFNPSEHHAFKWVERQLDESSTLTTEVNKIYAMNPYHVHRGIEATHNIYRKFLRISYTFTPITSVTSTLNNAIEYNYPAHSTTGKIPENLK